MDGALSEAIDAALALEVDDLDDAALHQELVALHRQADRLAAAQARVAAAWDARCVWAQDGSKSPGARLARDARCSRLTAGREVRRARKLRTMPATAAAFAAGNLSVDHVDVLTAANQPRVATLFARDEALLVAEGRRLHLDDFHRLVQHWRNIADDETAEDCATSQFDRRYLRAARTLDGVVDLQGRFPAIAGAIIKGELERLERELFDQDWAKARAEHGQDARPEHLARTSVQRMADALELMARRSAAVVADARPARPLVTVLVGYETFKGRVCQLADGTVLTPGQVAAVLGEADIERIVFDTPSRVLDVGVRRRFFTGATRRAVEVRDQHCWFPGCNEPAQRCEVDHIIEYGDGGETTQANGRLACPTHNRQRPGRALTSLPATVTAGRSP